MRYLIPLILTILTAPSVANDSDNQYTDATDTIKSIFEIINNRGMKCDAALDTYGIEAVSSEHCQPFMEAGSLMAKVKPQCDIIIAIAEAQTVTVEKKQKEGTLTKGELRAYNSKGAFLKEYCGSRPPARYSYISKTFKKIQLMSN